MTLDDSILDYLIQRYVGRWIQVRGKFTFFLIARVETEIETGEYDRPHFILFSSAADPIKRRRKVYIDQALPDALPFNPLP